MRTVRMTVYKSESYTIELSDEEFASFQDDNDSFYEFVCDNSIEPDDFGVDEITIETIKD